MAKSAGPAENSSTQKARLEKELKAMIPQIQEEGLLFLIQQANTIIHNQRIVALEKETAELRQGKSPAVQQKAGFDLEISRSADGKTYYLIVNGRKHFLDIQETRKIVDLCYRPPTRSAALKFLYQYFLNERDEILLEHKIQSGDSAFFPALFRTVREVFTPGS